MSWREQDQRAGERDWVAAVIAAADEPLDTRLPMDEAEPDGDDEIAVDDEDRVADQPAVVADEPAEPVETSWDDDFEDASEPVVEPAGSEPVPVPAPEPPPWWSDPGLTEMPAPAAALDEPT